MAVSFPFSDDVNAGCHEYAKTFGFSYAKHLENNNFRNIVAQTLFSASSEVSPILVSYFLGNKNQNIGRRLLTFHMKCCRKGKRGKNKNKNNCCKVSCTTCERKSLFGKV